MSSDDLTDEQRDIIRRWVDRTPDLPPYARRHIQQLVAEIRQRHRDHQESEAR